jgi:hypothetical protein
MKTVEYKAFDKVLKDEIKWHKSKEGVKATEYTKKEQRAFILGIKHAMFLLSKSATKTKI